jgi:hypothetical protein
MLARKIERPATPGYVGTGSSGGPEGPTRPGRWRRRGLVATWGPGGRVQWWERPAPGGDQLLWAAVVRLHQARQTAGVSMTRLAERMASCGHPIRRETLSRVLNGAQPTSWATAEAIAHVLGVSLDDLVAGSLVQLRLGEDR